MLASNPADSSTTSGTLQRDFEILGMALSMTLDITSVQRRLRKFRRLAGCSAWRFLGLTEHGGGQSCSMNFLDVV
jgi:hypothetical protein